MDLSIIIVNWNSGLLLEKCLASIQKYITGISYEAIVVDNCSEEADVNYLKDRLVPAFPWATFLFNENNLGYAAANNQGVKLSRGKYLLLLNPDTCFLEEGFTRLFSYLSNDVGLVSCKLLNEDLSTQISCFTFPMPGRVVATSLLLHKLLPAGLRRSFIYTSSDHDRAMHPDWVLGAFMLLTRELMIDLGGFDESVFMYGEDMDLCYRIRRKQLNILFTPVYKIIHYGGRSGKQAWSNAKREAMIYRAVFYFYRKHLGYSKLMIARFFYGLGALLRMVLYSLGCVLPSRRRRFLNELKTQWSVLQTQITG